MEKDNTRNNNLAQEDIHPSVTISQVAGKEFEVHYDSASNVREDQIKQVHGTDISGGVNRAPTSVDGTPNMRAAVNMGVGKVNMGNMGSATQSISYKT